MRCRINGRVPGRARPRRNPATVSGFPLINTFEGMGVMSTTTQASSAIQRGGPKQERSRFGKTRKLAKQNLMHRCDPDRDVRLGQIRQYFEAAVELSHKLDHATKNPSPMGRFDWWILGYNRCIRELRRLGAEHKVSELSRLEAARGRFYFKGNIQP